MGSNMSKCIPHISMNKTYLSMHIKTAGYMVARKLYKIENIAQDSTHAKITSPKLRTLEELNQRRLPKEKKLQLSKESVRSGYLPKLS